MLTCNARLGSLRARRSLTDIDSRIIHYLILVVSSNVDGNTILFGYVVSLLTVDLLIMLIVP